jgi:molybdopterin molybdotransferase
MTANKQHSCNDAIEHEAIGVEQAVAQIVQSCDALSGRQKLPLRDCLNRTLYEAIHSPLDVPAHNNSAMDGYAINSQDLSEEGVKAFKLIGTAFAGKPFMGVVGSGECVRIMTGAVMPQNTDCIVIQEDILGKNQDQVEIGFGHKKHQNVRFAGEDIKKGACVLDQGRLLQPADLGLVASLGIAECTVYRRPRVCFFSTGDELKSIGEALAQGEIYDSNRYTLWGLLSRSQVDVLDMGVVADDQEALKQALLSAAQQADMVITSGGVSVGEADFIKSVLNEIGQMNFWKIAMKPGRPLTFGKINNSLFFGLPGNPVAVMVTYFQFVLPCLKKLAGRTQTPVMHFKAACQSSIRKNSNRREFQRGYASIAQDGSLQVELTGKQGSGILNSMSKANCFIVLMEPESNPSPGDQVRVEFFDHYF